MPDKAQPPEETYSIVVVGPMNPRIHHPVWYRTIGLLSDEDLAAAVAESGDGSVLVLADLARFHAPKFHLICQADRWEVQTHDVANRELILNVARVVFAKLYETPIQRYGFNVVLHRRTSVSNVRERLADMIGSLGFGFSSAGARSSMVGYSNKFDAYSQTVQVQASPRGEDVVLVTHNVTREVTSATIDVVDDCHFDLGKLLQGTYDADYHEAVATAAAIVDGLTRTV